MLALPLMLIAGCSEENLPGFYWDVTVTASEDACNDPTVAYTDTFAYRAVFDGSDIDLFIGADKFASGELSGCDVSYTSVVWTEPREAGDVRWRLSGNARVAFGEDGGCVSETGWSGEEVFEVVATEDPALSVGCTFTMETTGEFVGEK